MRFKQPRQGDIPVSLELDSVFLGVDNRRAADLGDAVPSPGMMTAAVNVRFDNGDIATRGGVLQPRQFNLPAWSNIRGAGVYSDPDGREWVLVVTPTVVWMCNESTNPVRIALPAGVVINERVRLVQAFTTMLMCRGKDAELLVWEGDRFQPFRSVRQSAPSDDVPTFLEPPPNADWAVVMADRVFYPDGRDGIVWSDVLDYTRVDYTLASARFNTGEDDSIVYAAPYQGSRLVIFKTQSIHFLDNVGGDMSGVTIPDRLPGRIGCIAPDTVAAVGQDLFWLGQGGLHKLSQTAQGEMRGHAVPVSEPVLNTMARVNWPHASKSVGTVTDQFYYLALPLDGATEPNAVLVYDLKTDTWQGVDYYGGLPNQSEEVVVTGTGMWDPLSGVPLVFGETTVRAALLSGQAMLTSDWLGQRVAFLVGQDHVTVLGTGEVDRLGPGAEEREIYLMARSRGYMLGALRTKQLRTVAVCYGSKNAAVSVSVETDGQNERQLLQDKRTRDRTKFQSHGHAPFPLDNRDGKFAEPYRQDYTWRAGDAVKLGEGIPLGVLQTWDKPLPVRRIGRHFSVVVENFTGKIRVTGLVAEGLPETGGLIPK